jgi:3-oxoadipate enol-lactonase
VPHSIASLTIVGSFAKYPDAEKTVETIVGAAIEAGDLRSFAQARAERVVPPGAPAGRLRDTVEQMAKKSLPSYIASTKATWTGDFRADLPQITVPALVVCGELDPVAPLALSEEIASGIPGAQLTVIPGAGHVTNADAPETFNEVLSRFLRSTETIA